MLKIKSGKIYIVLLVLLYSSTCLGVTTQYNKLTQRLGSGSLVAVKNEIFNRDSYDTFGSGVSFSNTIDLQGKYSIPIGSKWTWQIYQFADEQDNPVNKLFSASSITYQGAVGGCPNLWSTGECKKAAGWALYWPAPCLAEGRYRLKVLFNGSVVGQDEFYPTQFTPIVTIEAPDSARPFLKGDTIAIKNMPDISGETFLVKVNVQGKVKSNDQCRAPLPNRIVRLTNTIKAETAGHQHFSSNNEIGTGRYTPFTDTGVLNPDNMPEINDTVIEGKTTELGNFFATFTTGHFGIVETITADVKREASPLYPETIVPALTHKLTIKASNLVKLDDVNNGREFIFRYFGSCKHNPTARWVVLGMRERLAILDSAYEGKFGHRLSFNDASLPFGGVMDNSTAEDKNTGIPKTGGRDNLCHKAHRRGNDIDINQNDENNENIRTESYLENGIPYKRLRFITKLAEKLDLEKIVEGPIHYRYINY